MNRAATLALGLLALTGTVAAKDLVGVFQDAVQNDPTIRQANANRLATREARPQAWAAGAAAAERHRGHHARPHLRLSGPGRRDQRSQLRALGDGHLPDRSGRGVAADDHRHDYQELGGEPALQPVLLDQLDEHQGCREGSRAGRGHLPGRRAGPDPARRHGVLHRPGRR